MDDPVIWFMEFTIKPGALAALSPLIEELAQSTHAEPGALQFAWFVSADGTHGQVHERYADPAAALAHLQIFVEQFAAPVLAAVDPTRFTVLGLPDEAVQAALAGFAPVYLRPLGGFARDFHQLVEVGPPR